MNQHSFSRKTNYTNYKGNVMTPLNWATGVFETVLLPVGSLQHSNWFGIVCIIFAGIVLLFYFGMFWYFSIKDPNRLQSEHYNLAKQELALATTEPDAKVSIPNMSIKISESTIPE